MCLRFELSPSNPHFRQLHAATNKKERNSFGWRAQNNNKNCSFFLRNPSGSACCWWMGKFSTTEHKLCVFCVCLVFYFLTRQADKLWIILASNEIAQRASTTTKTRTRFRPSAKCINISLLFQILWLFFSQILNTDLFESPSWSRCWISPMTSWFFFVP